MYAVIESGNKQYRVELGTEIQVDRLDVQAGDSITLERVLLIADGEDTAVGRPIVNGATVSADVLGQIRGEKIIVFKYKPKARHRVKKGFRAELTMLRISEIAFDGRSAAKDAQKSDAKKDKAAKAADIAATDQATADKALASKLTAASAPAEPEAAAESKSAAEPEAATKPKAKSAKTTTKTKSSSATKATAKTKSSSATKAAAARKSATKATDEAATEAQTSAEAAATPDAEDTSATAQDTQKDE